MKEESTQKVYDIDTQEDKHFFASFFNLAEDNLEAVFQLFKFKNGKPDSKVDIDQVIKDYFKKSLAPSELEMHISTISSHLPVFERFGYYIDEKNQVQYDGKRIASEFELLLTVLNKLRSFYSHFEHDPLLLDSNEIDFLENRFSSVFDTVVNNVKQKKMKTDKTREAFKQTLNKEILVLKKLQKNKILEKKPRIKPSEDDLMNGIINRAFSHLEVGKRNSYNLKYRDFELRINDTSGIGNPLSECLTIFILSCFLSRDENELLRSKIKGYKAKFIHFDENELSLDQNSLKFTATQWVFSELSYKRIRTKIDTTTVKETLLMQVLDYLSKVPNELYEVLPKSTQNSFLEDVNSYYSESNRQQSMENALVTHPVIRKRYEDKFNYFALRYLDECANFPSLRFQVHLGNFVHHNQEKEIKGTNLTTNRKITEKIKCYGKLSEIIDLKNDKIEEIIENQKTNNKGVWEVFPNPSYNFVEGNIPIYVKENPNFTRAKNEFNSEVRKDEKKSKIDLINELEKQEISTKNTVALLSLNEIPALLHLVLSSDQGYKKAESNLIGKLAQRFEAFNKETSNFSLPKSWNKLNNENSILENLDRLFKTEIEDTKLRLEYIDSKRKEAAQLTKESRNGKVYRVFGLNETGEIASWIAKEIVRFMPATIRANWKGYNHAHLQKLISLYEVEKGKAKLFLGEFLDLSLNKERYACFNKQNFDDFYQDFLKFKQDDFQRLIEQSKEAKSSSKVRAIFIKNEIKPFFSKRLYEVKSREILKHRFQGMPAALAHGVFDSKPTFIPGKSLEENQNEFADWFVKTSDKNIFFQKFYQENMDFEHAYVESLTKEEQKGYKINPLNFAKKKIRFKRKQIGAINEIKRKDVLLWEMAKKLGSEIGITLDEFNLSNTFVSKSERESVTFEDANFIWSKTIDYRSKDGRISQKNVKLKDLGKMKRWELNPRVLRLLELTQNNFTVDQLKQEFEKDSNSYEFLRSEKVFKVIHELEKTILVRSNEQDLRISNNPNFNTYVTVGILNKIREISANEENYLKVNFKESNFNVVPESIYQQEIDIQKAFILIALRNKFAHNQLPSSSFYNLCEKFFDKEEEETYSLYFCKCLENIALEFKNELEK